MFGRLRQCMETGAPQQLTNEFTYPDGRTGWFELRVQRVAVGIVVLSIDVSRQRELERNLEHALRMEALGRLAGTVAHDFNNLLTIIASHAAFAERGASPEAAEDLRHVLAAAERGASLTAQLLAFARRKPVSPTPIEPWKVVRQVLALSGRAMGSGVEVVASERVELPPVVIDPGALEQVLLNLVMNARDAMRGSGRLAVDGREVVLESDQEWSRGEPVPPGRYVVLSITDTGCGMSREVRDRLFEPFFSTKGERGTGLGLSSSFGLVRQAGGYISVYSEVGKGATFRVYLPARGASPVEQRSNAPVTIVDGTETILVVDDDEAVLRVVTRALRQFGYSVRGARSAREAVAELEREVADLMLTDVALTDGAGPELARVARSRWPKLEILLMSGFSPLTRSQDGAFEWLEKPLSPVQLASRIRATLDRRRGQLLGP